MIYYTADLHLGHAKVVSFDKRPFKSIEEMDRTLIANWNSRVTDEDQVYIAGDLIYKSKKPPEWYLKQLRGIKYLVIGNHEKTILESEKACGCFAAIDKMMHISDGQKQICMCHFPIVEWNGYFRRHYHIFGHIHNARNRAYEVMKEEPRALNAGCMLNRYMPVTFEELVVNNRLFQEKAISDEEEPAPRNACHANIAEYQPSLSYEE